MKVNKIVEKMQTEIDTLKRQVAELYALCEKEVSGSGELMTSRRRDEIVEQAKRDVDALLNEYQLSEKEALFYRNKREVSVSIKHLFSGKTITSGIAKCAPTDCFNVHIGKAIALRRALGLYVPIEYLNTPQPTEVRVGDVIKVNVDDGSVEIKPVISLNDGRLNVSLPGRMIEFPSSYAQLIDDSRE